MATIVFLPGILIQWKRVKGLNGENIEEVETLRIRIFRLVHACLSFWLFLVVMEYLPREWLPVSFYVLAAIVIYVIPTVFNHFFLSKEEETQTEKVADE